MKPANLWGVSFGDGRAEVGTEPGSAVRERRMSGRDPEPRACDRSDPMAAIDPGKDRFGFSPL